MAPGRGRHPHAISGVRTRRSAPSRGRSRRACSVIHNGSGERPSRATRAAAAPRVAATVAAIRAGVGAAELVRRAAGSATDLSRGLARTVLTLLALAARSAAPPATVVAAVFAGAVGLAALGQADADTDCSRFITGDGQGEGGSGHPVDTGDDAPGLVTAAIRVRSARRLAKRDGSARALCCPVGGLHTTAAGRGTGVWARDAGSIMAARRAAVQRARAALQGAPAAVGLRAADGAQRLTARLGAGRALLRDAPLSRATDLAGRAPIAARLAGGPRLAGAIRGAAAMGAGLRGTGRDALAVLALELPRT
jgi:hypothetical protein